MTVKSCVEPRPSLDMRTVALPWPRSAPFGIVVRNVAMPLAAVVPSGGDRRDARDRQGERHSRAGERPAIRIAGGRGQPDAIGQVASA